MPSWFSGCFCGNGDSIDRLPNDSGAGVPLDAPSGTFPAVYAPGARATLLQQALASMPTEQQGAFLSKDPSLDPLPIDADGLGGVSIIDDGLDGRIFEAHPERQPPAQLQMTGSMMTTKAGCPRDHPRACPAPSAYQRYIRTAGAAEPCKQNALMIATSLQVTGRSRSIMSSVQRFATLEKQILGPKSADSIQQNFSRKASGSGQSPNWAALGRSTLGATAATTSTDPPSHTYHHISKHQGTVLTSILANPRGISFTHQARHQPPQPLGQRTYSISGASGSRVQSSRDETQSSNINWMCRQPSASTKNQPQPCTALHSSQLSRLQRHATGFGPDYSAGSERGPRSATACYEGPSSPYLSPGSKSNNLIPRVNSGEALAPCTPP